MRADESLTPVQRDTQLKRLEGLATILAQIATREPSLFSLLQEDAEISDATRRLEREMQIQAGLEPEPEPEPSATPFSGVTRERTALPQSVVQAQLANPFLVPDFSQAAPRVLGRLAGWELIEPLLNSFEQAAAGAAASMELPEPRPMLLPPGVDLMSHQAKLLASAAEGHRTFLLADEPGLGKTAQALLAAQVAGAYPLLCIVPNVVKTNWAREAADVDPAAARSRSSTVTAATSTGSPTSWWSTTRCSTGTSAGWASTASAAWSSTRRTTSRTRSRSARRTSSRSPTGSGSASRGR